MSGWTAIATAAAVEPGGRIEVRVGDEEAVLWRTASGELRLFDNRCPHRGMRLSFGLVRGEHLVCLYHGWRYDGAGRCRAIPAHPDLDPPATIRVPVRPVAEAAGLVFAASGARPASRPKVPAGTYRPCRSVFVDVPPARLAAAVADALHPGRFEVRGDMILWERPDGGAAALVALQAVGGGAAAHASAAGPPAAAVRLADTLARLRDRLGEGRP